jgi:hypothetical protein
MSLRPPSPPPQPRRARTEDYHYYDASRASLRQEEAAEQLRLQQVGRAYEAHVAEMARAARYRYHAALHSHLNGHCFASPDAWRSQKRAAAPEEEEDRAPTPPPTKKVAHAAARRLQPFTVEAARAAVRRSLHPTEEEEHAAVLAHRAWQTRNSSGSRW